MVIRDYLVPSILDPPMKRLAVAVSGHPTKQLNAITKLFVYDVPMLGIWWRGGRSCAAQIIGNFMCGQKS